MWQLFHGEKLKWTKLELLPYSIVVLVELFDEDNWDFLQVFTALRLEFHLIRLHSTLILIFLRWFKSIHFDLQFVEPRFVYVPCFCHWTVWFWIFVLLIFRRPHSGHAIYFQISTRLLDFHHRSASHTLHLNYSTFRMSELSFPSISPHLRSIQILTDCDWLAEFLMFTLAETFLHSSFRSVSADSGTSAGPEFRSVWIPNSFICIWKSAENGESVANGGRGRGNW